MRRRRKKIFRGVALAFALAAFAVPTAQARPLTKWGTNPLATSAASRYTAPQLRALELQSQGMNERYGLTGRTTSSVQSSTAPVLVASSGGFKWSDAFVGAVATIATALVLAVGFTAVRRREQPVRI